MTSSSSSPNKHILHITEINAPIDNVWDVLIDLPSWKEWNKWTLLEVVSSEKKEENSSTTTIKDGDKGKLYASFEGDGKWDTYDCEFGTTSKELHLLTWKGNVGPGGCLFSGVHTMKLEKVTDDVTRLRHEEYFGGLLPMMNAGMPYQSVDRNYGLINAALKEYVEQQQQINNNNYKIQRGDEVAGKKIKRE